MRKNAGLFDEQWDVVIIGAGMGGLICGTSLARRGKKVKIIEQHHQPGGYFTIFRRKGFTFDAAFHVMGECEEGGWFYNVLKTLDLQDRVDFCRVNWRILYPGGSIELPPGVDRVLQVLTEKFPEEREGLVRLFETMKSIRKELDQLPSPGPTIEKYKMVTFQHLLDEYLNDDTLKAILSGCWPYTGLPPSKVSAVFMSGLSMVYFFSQGPFYPKGGPKALVDSIVGLFKENGGELELNSMVEEIIVEGGRAIGVRTRSGKRIGARYVVSNADARQTFNRLISQEFLNPAFMEDLETSPLSAAL